jgi:tRNA dimethylallyltransferase
MNRKIITILGPTASGKTALGVYLAKKLDGEIISADSRQVYKGLDIGTGKDLSEYGKVKYHIIDICKPSEPFTLFDWLTLARKKIDELISAGKLPIIVGGTNLYIKALAEGFEVSKIETGKLKAKNYTREYLDRQSAEKLVRILQKLAPNSLKTIDQKNPRRLIRAIETAQSGQKPVKVKPDFEILQLGIKLPREELYNKIDTRVDKRFKEGMLEEVRTLVKSGVDKKWLVGLGLEYKIITNFLASGDRDFAKMSQELKWKSHQYARRQLTWLNKNTNLIWVNNQTKALKKAKSFLHEPK